MHRVLAAGACQLSKGWWSHASTLFLFVTPFGIHTEVQLFAAQLLVLVAAVCRVVQHVTQPVTTARWSLHGSA
jgi:hypothetical protein